MGYPSVDKLQNALAQNVFHYTKDAKKAAGRALGTIVEIISYYLLKSWDFERSILIEKGLLEYKNPTISHNVEYTLHPIKELFQFKISPLTLPLTVAKLAKNNKTLNQTLNRFDLRASCLLSTGNIVRNSCLLGSNKDANIVAFLGDLNRNSAMVTIAEQSTKPFAMVECKRVGVEEGTKKGPQTIEKAKQGAYVARTVSSLQKIRDANGVLYGALPKGDGTFYIKPYKDFLKEIVDSHDLKFLKDFILTIGVVSNHGNWFTSENPNKELLVLAQSYDWLIFLTDNGMASFIEDLILNPKKDYLAVKIAFEKSYVAGKKKNQFTKVQMQYDADQALQKYFRTNLNKIEKWFNIIAPQDFSLLDLKQELHSLSQKDWFPSTRNI